MLHEHIQDEVEHLDFEFNTLMIAHAAGGTRATLIGSHYPYCD